MGMRDGDPEERSCRWMDDVKERYRKNKIEREIGREVEREGKEDRVLENERGRDRVRERERASQTMRDRQKTKSGRLDTCTVKACPIKQLFLYRQ